MIEIHIIRVKKQHHEFTSGHTTGANVTRLATVGVARSHNGGASYGNPAPVSTPCVPILEIGAPTSVTINGVTVTSSEDVEIVPNTSNDNNNITQKQANVSTFKVSKRSPYLSETYVK